MGEREQDHTSVRQPQKPDEMYAVSHFPTPTWIDGIAHGREHDPGKDLIQHDPKGVHVCLLVVWLVVVDLGAHVPEGCMRGGETTSLLSSEKEIVNRNHVHHIMPACGAEGTNILHHNMNCREV